MPPLVSERFEYHHGLAGSALFACGRTWSTTSTFLGSPRVQVAHRIQKGLEALHLELRAGLGLSLSELHARKREATEISKVLPGSPRLLAEVLD